MERERKKEAEKEKSNLKVEGEDHAELKYINSPMILGLHLKDWVF